MLDSVQSLRRHAGDDALVFPSPQAGSGSLSAATVAGGHEVGRSRRRGVASRLALDVPHVGIGASGRGLRGDGNESVACGRLGCRTDLFAVDYSGQASGTARRMVRVPCRRCRGHRRRPPQPASDNIAVSARRMFRSECCNLRWRCSSPHLERAYETPGAALLLILTDPGRIPLPSPARELPCGTSRVRCARSRPAPRGRSGAWQRPARSPTRLRPSGVSQKCLYTFLVWPMWPTGCRNARFLGRFWAAAVLLRGSRTANLF